MQTSRNKMRVLAGPSVGWFRSRMAALQPGSCLSACTCSACTVAMLLAWAQGPLFLWCFLLNSCFLQNVEFTGVPAVFFVLWQCWIHFDGMQTRCWCVPLWSDCARACNIGFCLRKAWFLGLKYGLMLRVHCCYEAVMLFEQQDL